MNLFRIHIRPDGGTADMAQSFSYCLRNRILGVGWRVDGLPENPTWEQYDEKASPVHLDGYQGCRYLQRNVRAGDLLWTRSTAGEYYLARARTGWKYWQGQEAIDDDIDIANVVECEFCKVPVEAVAGKVIACFRPTRAIQRIADDRALEYSKSLWNDLSGENAYELTKPGGTGDLFVMLDDEDTEDLVSIYLQKQGWLLVPNSRKSDTMSYEYYLVRPDSGDVAVAQIKTGNSVIDQDIYSQYSQTVFLFQPNNAYSGTRGSNVMIIERDTLLAFFREAKAWLPLSLRRKADLIGFI